MECFAYMVPTMEDEELCLSLMVELGSFVGEFVFFPLFHDYFTGISEPKVSFSLSGV